MGERVTKEQYEFFRSLYDEEERTANQLEGRSKVYLGLASAILAAILLKADDAQNLAKALAVPRKLLFLDALVVIVALLLVLLAVRFRNYEAVTDGRSLIQSYAGQWPNEDQFYGDRIADFAAASMANRTINSEVATLLKWAGWLMFGAVLGLLALVILGL